MGGKSLPCRGQEAPQRALWVACHSAGPAVNIARETPGDAAHLATAQEMGEREIWTSDRHLLAAASHFGLEGRTA
ncbi:MAG: hypothetical protein LAP87_22025 [Acidobacteriia bacterium]|nr:hypothetical protein [Terriglobia bacterium]